MRIVVGFAAGGIADTLARLYAEEIKSRQNRIVVVENRPGGSGMVAAQQVSLARPDGSTLMMISGTYTIVPAMQKIAFDPIGDITPISLIATSPNMIVVSADSKIDSLAKLAEEARATPGQLSYATSGTGTTVHFLGLLLERQAKVSLNHIPYKSSGESLQAIVGGHVPIGVSAVNSALPLVSSGQLRPLAVASSRRSVFLPDVPTFAEAGFPGIESETWLGLVGPKAMQRQDVDAIDSVVRATLQEPRIRSRLANLGAEERYAGPNDFRSLMADEVDRYERLARIAGLEKG